MSAPGPKRAEVDSGLAAEFPGIGLICVACGPSRASSPGVIRELDALSERIRGSQAVQAAGEPVAAAYRALRAQLGMDPDAGEGTLESLVRRRLVEGGFRSRGSVEDAVAIVTLETAVPIFAVPMADRDVRVGVAPQSGVVALMRGEDPVRPVFGPSRPTSRNERSGEVELCALIAPGLDPRFVEAALLRAVELSAA